MSAMTASDPQAAFARRVKSAPIFWAASAATVPPASSSTRRREAVTTSTSARVLSLFVVWIVNAKTLPAPIDALANRDLGVIPKAVAWTSTNASPLYHLRAGPNVFTRICFYRPNDSRYLPAAMCQYVGVLSVPLPTRVLLRFRNCATAARFEILSFQGTGSRPTPEAASISMNVTNIKTSVLATARTNRDPTSAPARKDTSCRKTRGPAKILTSARPPRAPLVVARGSNASIHAAVSNASTLLAPRNTTGSRPASGANCVRPRGSAATLKM